MTQRAGWQEGYLVVLLKIKEILCKKKANSVFFYNMLKSSVRWQRPSSDEAVFQLLLYSVCKMLWDDKNHSRNSY